MNDTTYTAYVLDTHRAADLARQSELMRVQLDRGQAPARPAGRPLSAWFRGVLALGSHGAAVAPGH